MCRTNKSGVNVTFGDLSNSVFITKFKALKYALLLIIINSSVGCTSIDDGYSVQSNNNLPKQKAQLTQWQVSGRILISTAEDKHSGYYYWQQNEETFTLSVNSFLGTNILTLKSDTDKSSLKFDGDTYYDQDASILLYRLTGNYVPVHNFKYWLLGLTTGQESNIESDSTGQVSSFDFFSLSNTKWQVQYASGEITSGYILPKQVTVKGQKTKIKMSLSTWELIN